jgi:hypothetical protein
LIDFIRDILKIVKLNCHPVLRQVTGIAQTISDLRCFLLGPPEGRASLVGLAIAGSGPGYTVFACWIAGLGKLEDIWAY